MPTDRRRVLLLIKCLGYGGAERLLVDMIRHGNRERFDYSAAYILTRESGLVAELREQDIPVYDLGARSNSDLVWMAGLRRLLERGHFDLVHFHLPYAAALGRPVVATLPRRSRPVTIYTEHNMWDKMALLLRAANRVSIHRDRRLLVVSEAARRSLPPALRRRAEVVRHGIELDSLERVRADRARHRDEVRRELDVPAGHLLALVVANLRREKAYDVLLPAARDLMERGVPLRFAAVGRGPLQESLNRMHEQFRLGSYFRFLGPRSDVWRLMAAADMFVLPSRQEGLPVALMEATGMGLPCVVTSVGEHPELLRHRVDSLIVAPGDTGALAEAMAELADDSELRDRLGAGARLVGAQFDVAWAVRRVEDMYGDLCEAR